MPIGRDEIQHYLSYRDEIGKERTVEIVVHFEPFIFAMIKGISMGYESALKDQGFTHMQAQTVTAMVSKTLTDLSLLFTLKYAGQMIEALEIADKGSTDSMTAVEIEERFTNLIKGQADKVVKPINSVNLIKDTRRLNN